MKRILFFLLLIVPFVFISCSNDDDKEEEPTMMGIKVISKFDTGDKGPEGRVYIFNLDNTHPKDLNPYFSGDICYLRDVNGESIFSIYEAKIGSDKDASGKYINSSTNAIYTDKLSYLYGKPEIKGKYLLVINVRRNPSDIKYSGNSYSYKEVTFSNQTLEKTFKQQPPKEDIPLFSDYHDLW